MTLVALCEELVFTLYNDYVDDDNPNLEEALRFLIKFHRENTEDEI